MDVVLINRAALPPEERETAVFIEANLRSLRMAAEAFRHTVDLFMHIRDLIRTTDLDVWRKVAWTRIAGRNGAIEAYSFGMVMELINDARREAPVMWSEVDIAKKKAASKLFAKEFATISGVRNSTAHPGQLSGSPEEIAKHRLLGIGLFIGDNMQATDEALTFGATYKQQLVTYELSYPKADALERVASLYHDAFRPLDVFTASPQRGPARRADEQRDTD
jgi:hypothetical protein